MVRLEYAELVREFVDGEVEVRTFEERFLKRFKSESRELDERTFLELDELFAATDALCTDEVLLAGLVSEGRTDHLSRSEFEEIAGRLLDRLRR